METLRTATTLLETFYGKDSPYSRGWLWRPRTYGTTALYGEQPQRRLTFRPDRPHANTMYARYLLDSMYLISLPCMRAPPHIQLRRALSSLLLPSGGSSTELGHFSDILTLHQPHTNFFSRRWDFALLKPSIESFILYWDRQQ